MIEIDKVTKQSFKKIIQMKLARNQNKYLDTNIYTLAQAWIYHENARPFIIKNDNEAVGFFLLYFDDNLRYSEIIHFMIDRNHQHKGYGREALKQIINYIKSLNKYDAIYLAYKPDNISAHSLYLHHGFIDTTKIYNKERIMLLKINNNPKIGYSKVTLEERTELYKLISLYKSLIKIPNMFNRRKLLYQLINDNKLYKFTLYGETIGIYDNDNLWIIPNYNNYLEEINLLLTTKLNNQI